MMIREPFPQFPVLQQIQNLPGGNKVAGTKSKVAVSKLV
jgi:hypothetical protein